MKNVPFRTRTVKRWLGPVAAFGLLAVGSPVLAQQAPGADVSARSMVSSRVGGAPSARYEDTATQRVFVLDRSGGRVLMKFEDSPEVYVLRATTAQRGDTFLRTADGRLMLRVTELGNVISYFGNADGAPAAVAAVTSPLDAPAVPEDLAEQVAQAVERLSALAGHEVTVFGAGAFAREEHWASDALMMMQIGVERSGAAASRLTAVRIVRTDTPQATFQDGELVIGVDPAKGYAGRPSSDAVARAMFARK